MTRILFSFCLLLAFGWTQDSAQAQLLRRAREAAQRGAERAVERQAERQTEDAIDGALGGSTAAPAAATTTSPAAAGTQAPAPGDVPLVGYDFVPGDHNLFVDDFTSTPVGDFPRRITFLEGNAEVAEWQGQRFLRYTSRGGFAIELPEDLPARFTLELETAVPSGAYQEIYFSDGAATFVRYWPYDGGLDGRPRAMAKPSAEPGPGVRFPLKLMVDGDYVKVYMNGTRVANVPNAKIGRSRTIRFQVVASEQQPAYFGSFRLAAGGRDLSTVAEAVAEVQPEAPLVLQGVVFDTGSARLRAESGPTLDAVATSLKAHGDVRVRIEGHTDNTGAADANRTLSQARAESVQAALVARGVDATRLEAVGYGPDQPVAPNDTPEGRQQNRRVALARL